MPINTAAKYFILFMFFILLLVVGFGCLRVTQSKTLAKSVELVLFDLCFHSNMLLLSDLRF